MRHRIRTFFYFPGISSHYCCCCGSQQQHSITLRSFIYIFSNVQKVCLINSVTLFTPAHIVYAGKSWILLMSLDCLCVCEKHVLICFVRMKVKLFMCSGFSHVLVCTFWYMSHIFWFITCRVCRFCICSHFCILLRWSS